MSLLAARGSPVRRAALYGAAGAVVTALAAALLKTAANTFAVDGPTVVLSTWPAGLHPALAAVSSAVLDQAALHTSGR